MRAPPLTASAMLATAMLVTATALAACGEAECPPGSARSEGRCVDAPDAGTDAGAADAGGEQDGAPPDAGPCGPCTGALPHCDATLGACVACLDDAHCEQDTAPVCAAGQCVECAGPEACTSPDASRCEANACTGCTADSDCAHLSGTPACLGGACVECTANEHCGDGEGCVLETQTCRSYTPGSADPCAPCVADDECRPGMLCVAMTFRAEPVGQFCAWRRDATGPGAPNGSCSAARPLIHAASLTSADGVVADVCVPLTSTCPALADFRTTCTTATGATPSDECGAEGYDDGFCRVAGPTTNRCSAECLTFDDCPCTGGSCAAQVACTGGFCDFGRTCVVATGVCT